jgi:hypothetical protein
MTNRITNDGMLISHALVMRLRRCRTGIGLMAHFIEILASAVEILGDAGRAGAEIVPIADAESSQRGNGTAIHNFSTTASKQEIPPLCF